MQRIEYVFINMCIYLYNYILTLFRSSRVIRRETVRRSREKNCWMNSLYNYKVGIL